MLSAFHTNADRGTDTHFLMNPTKAEYTTLVGFIERALGAHFRSFDIIKSNHPAINQCESDPSKERITE